MLARSVKEELTPGQVDVAWVLMLSATVLSMSEWLKEHAWKAKVATLTVRRPNTLWRNRFNDFPPQNAS